MHAARGPWPVRFSHPVKAACGRLLSEWSRTERRSSLLPELRLVASDHVTPPPCHLLPASACWCVPGTLLGRAKWKRQPAVVGTVRQESHARARKPSPATEHSHVGAREGDPRLPSAGKPDLRHGAVRGSDQKTRGAVRIAPGMEGNWQLPLPPWVARPVRVRKHVHVKEQTCARHHMPCGLEQLPALRGGNSGGRLPVSVALSEAWMDTRSLVLPCVGP